MSSQRSKVEVKGFEARHYDFLMGLLTVGSYSRWIRRAVRKAGAEEGWKIAELGSGTGIAACEFVRLIGEGGRYIGLDVGEEMMGKARKRCREKPNVQFIRNRIEEPFHLPFKADLFFLSFVIHGLEDCDKEKVIANVKKNLRDGGFLAVFDYSQMKLAESSWFRKLLIGKLECPLAAEFVEMNFPSFVGEQGFSTHRIEKEFHALFSLYIFKKR